MRSPSTTPRSATSASRSEPRAPGTDARLALAVLVLAAALGGCAQVSPRGGWSDYTADEGYAAAAALEARGRGSEALARYREVRRRDPENAAALLREVELTHAPPAVAELDQELASGASSSDVPARRSLYATGRALLLGDDAASSLAREKLLRQALEDDPANALALASLARLLESRDDADEAFLLWQRAVATERAPPRALWGFARSCIERRDEGAAVDALRELVKLSPDDGAARFNLGTLLLERRDDAEAYENLSRAYRLLPAARDVGLNLSSAAIRVGRLDEAEELLTSALRASPDDPWIHFNLAVFYADHRDDPAAAIRHFRRYLALGGEDTLRVERWLEELSEELER